MKVEHQRQVPAGHGVPSPPKQWPTALIVLLIFFGAFGGTYALLKAGEARSDKIFHSLLFDGVDGGLKTALPSGIHKTLQNVMMVYLKPAEQIKRAKAVINGVQAKTGEVSRMQERTNSFLDSWIAIAAVVCTGFGLFVRIVLNLTVWH